MLDRMSLIAPDWTERNAGRRRGRARRDCSPTSPTSSRYRQDAVATEAYLGTARRRAVAAAARPAGRLPRARGLQRARCGCGCPSAAPGSRSRGAPQLLTRVPDVPERDRARRPRPTVRRSPRAPRSFETVERRRALRVARRASTSGRGATHGCCLPRGRDRRRRSLGDHPRAAAPATCSSSPRSPGRSPGSPRTPTRRSARPCG